MFPFQRRKKAQRKHQPASAKRSRSGVAARSRLFLEPLEERTLLSLGQGLDNVFTSLQTALNDHLWKPPANLGTGTYSLPLVGTHLASDPQAQFLSAIATAVQNETDPSKLQSDIAAVVGPVVTVTAPSGNQTDYEIQISGAKINGLVEPFDSGMPGLQSSTRDEEPGRDGKHRVWAGVRSQLSSFKAHLLSGYLISASDAYSLYVWLAVQQVACGCSLDRLAYRSLRNSAMIFRTTAAGIA
jgi:hypothetical protein